MRKKLKIFKFKRRIEKYRNRLFIYNIEKMQKDLEEIVKNEEIYNNQCEDEQQSLDRIKALKRRT